MEGIFNKLKVDYLIKVGDKTYLPGYEKKAEAYARHTGQKVTKINRPKKKKNAE